MAGVNLFSLEGKTAAVIGASRGIGLAIAQALARSGADTVLTARSLNKLEQHAGELRKEGYRARALAFDVVKPDWDVLEACGEIDILINVTGTNRRKRFEDYSREEYDWLLETNLHGLVAVTQRVGRRMIERGRGGKVVFIGSLMSLLGLPYLAVYAMSKSALAGLTRVLAAEWGPHNIQVNCIAPGFILTDLNRDMWQAPEMAQWLSGVQANQRLGKPEDIAPLAVLLSGPGSDYITGQVIAVDGGYTTTARWPFLP
jgi:gluconate 5-dehydrogenase